MTAEPTRDAPTASPGDSARGEPPAGSADLSRFLNASFVRHDTWDRLRAASERMSRGVRPEGSRREVAEALALLKPIELYWAFPGRRALRQLEELVSEENWGLLARRVGRVSRLLASGTYRRRATAAANERSWEEDVDLDSGAGLGEDVESRPYFEVLVVDDLGEEEEDEVRRRLLELRADDDPFVYDLVVVPSLEDALIAVLFNYGIQSCVVRYSVPLRSEQRLEVLQGYLAALGPHRLDEELDGKSSITLGRLLREVRPELDLFLVTDVPVDDVAGGRLPFRRVFYRQEDYAELHGNLLKGVGDRYRTPFFSALKSYSQRPTGVFHAMPLSRGKSIARSHWIQDMARFYGHKIFQAETSATTGGLDSLLQPQGTLREAQDLAARAFGAKRTYFVTNGTSAANKIVAHALLQPGDIALVARDCHKSHHYAMQLAGALPFYLDPYPLSEYSFYGAVPLRQIKAQLLALRAAGKLDRVRMLLLTNCTFDGITYHPERVMQECLAIKPDLVFLWDEAWFAFATFHPTLRRRTGMEAARRLRDRFKTPEYRRTWERWRERWEALPDDESRWLDHELLPDPDRARLRVYVTQSTHKTLTALRQGSMIHVFDQDFERVSADSFTSAYMTYTSTSPNYQILASLDIGRRQVELEGYELVQRCIELSMTLRRRLASQPLLDRYFRVLGAAEMVPEEFRPSGLTGYYDPQTGWVRMEEAWARDEFALDPTRVTVWIAGVGMDGDAFKEHLMDSFDIQINKTSRNTVLFMVHIGTTRGAITHLIEVLTRIAQDLEERHEDLGPAERELYRRRVRALTEELPPLPNFSRFHRAFLSSPDAKTREGDLRSASFLAYDGERCEHLPLDGTLRAEVEAGREIVSAGFVTPYPPGFPVLVPGQVLSPEILHYLEKVEVKEIHGYRPELGLRVFRREALEKYEEQKA
ncbi:MAG TPA: ornithine decarboxylase [Thermoanaerobaculia bacterium]|nr:ornithine decarboxylase [Thermoanaerobaculia bacterium]